MSDRIIFGGEQDDYLLEGLEKAAAPRTFTGEIMPIWSVQDDGLGAAVLVRPEDPFAELRCAVEEHKAEEAELECELTEQAEEVRELRQMLEAKKTACIEPVRERLDLMEDRIEQHLDERAELEAEINRAADETVTLIDLFRDRGSEAKEGSRRRPFGRRAAGTKKDAAWRWRTQPSASMSGTCPTCDQYDGQVFEEYNELPPHPLHPNCKCEIDEV